MSAIPWIIISIGVLIVLLAVIAILISRKKDKKHEPDYYSFFIMGVIWTMFGIIFFKDMFYFLGIGIVFMILGLSNKNKWKQNHKTWKQLSDKEQKLKIIVMLVLGILVLLGLIVYYFLR
jgi:formate hydrogenlyase subunit 3/multisubunit Na+/H+ antiporter MnhD subunit